MPAQSAVKLCQKTNALVVLDEAYMEFYDNSAVPLINDYESLIVLKTCSKALGMAGIRLGFAVSGLKNINALKAAKSPYNVNVLTQRVGEVVLSDRAAIKQNINEIIKQRDILYEGLKKLEGGVMERVFETNTNFVFVKPKSAKDVYGHMLKNGIAIRIMGEYLRITAGSEEENAEFLRVLSLFQK
jgi:histidinol-phosphate aminotransferase